MQTIALRNNDLYLDEFGNIAIIEGQAQKAQDASTSIKVVKGECYFDTERGVPYNNVLGEPVNQSLIQEYVNSEAKRIEGVLGASAVFTSFDNRDLNFDILVSTEEGVISGI